MQTEYAASDISRTINFYYVTIRILSIVLFLLTCTACQKMSLAKENQKIANQLVETGVATQTLDSTNVTNATNGLYVCLPGHYNETTKNYPLLVSIHGGGQIGSADSALHLVLNDGLAQLIQLKKFPASFTVNGQNFSFIVLAPQFTGYPSSQQVEDFILYAKRRYRVDASRIYVTGLSMGGFVCSKIGGDFTSELAAIVPMSGAVDDTTVCRNIAKGKLPVWIFQNSEDPVVEVGFAKNYVSLINKFNPVYPPRLTIFINNIHDAWTPALNPLYKENGLNIYEWMLQYSR